MTQLYGDEMARTFRERVHEARRVVWMVSPEQARTMIDRGQVMVIDVGEAWQLEARGTIPGARNITRCELDVRADTQEAQGLRIARPDADDSAYLRRRRQSHAFGCTLLEMGFTDVFGAARRGRRRVSRLSNLGPRLQADSTSMLFRASRALPA